MPTQNSIDYLHSVKIIVEPPGAGVFIMGANHAHRRPIRPLPDLLGPDTPWSRVISVKPEERIPYGPPFRVFDDDLLDLLAPADCCS